MSERGKEGRKKIFPAGTARALGGSLARREYLFPHPAHFGSTYLPLGRENSLFSGRIPLAALLGREIGLFSGRTPRTALLGREIGLFSGRAPRAALLGRENSLFSGRTPREALLGRENSTFSGRGCHKVPFPLDRLWFFARLSTQSWLSLDGGSVGDRCVGRIRAGARSGR